MGPLDCANATLRVLLSLLCSFVVVAVDSKQPSTLGKVLSPMVVAAAIVARHHRRLRHQMGPLGSSLVKKSVCVCVWVAGVGSYELGNQKRPLPPPYGGGYHR